MFTMEDHWAAPEQPPQKSKERQFPTSVLSGTSSRSGSDGTVLNSFRNEHEVTTMTGSEKSPTEYAGLKPEYCRLSKLCLLHQNGLIRSESCVDKQMVLTPRSGMCNF